MGVGENPKRKGQEIIAEYDPTPLFTEREILKRNAELADEISEDYKKEGITDVTAIIILDGAIFFGVDLVRLLKIPNLRIETLAVATYEGTSSSKEPQIIKDTRRDIEDDHILLIEDVRDKGHTLRKVQSHLKSKKVKSLRTVVFVEKSDSELEVSDIEVQYAGFRGVNKWVGGRGFDEDGYMRNLLDVLAKKTL